jgi:hypothetical protein
VVTNAPTRDGGRALWSPDLGQSVRMQASSNAFKVAPGLVAAALAAVLVPVLAVIVAVRRRRRGRQRRGGGR